MGAGHGDGDAGNAGDAGDAGNAGDAGDAGIAEAAVASGVAGEAERAAPGGPTTGAETRGLSVKLRALWRFLLVCYRFLPLVGAYVRDRRRYVLVGGSREVTTADQRRRAEYLLDTLLDLGPTFIKFGQMLSTRPDVLPRPYVEVLSRLQDEVPPDDWAAIEPVIESELGPVEEAFASFDREPISGASLGQVYTARVEDRRVAVKVLRPDIRERVAADLRVLDTLVPALARFAPPGQAFTLENLADEFAATIHEEMDYEHEAAMLRTVRENFADWERLRIPQPLRSHSTDRVLTMEYVEGTKITDVETLDERGVDREAVVERLERAYIKMVVEDGVFHADPHPGNLAVQDDGTVVLYDFGMCGRLDARTRERLFDFYVALAEDDIDAVIDAFIALDALDPDVDRELMRAVFDLGIEQFRGGQIDQYQIQEIVAEFQSELYDFPMRLPQNLALVVRVSTVLEGVCRTLDPEFDFIDTVTEYVRERQSESGYERLREEASERARAVGRASVRVPPTLESVLSRLDTGSLEVKTALFDDERLLRRAVRQVTLGACLAGTVVLASGLYAFGDATSAAVAATAVLPFGYLLRRSFRTGTLGPTVQFTRHEMRHQDRDGSDRL